MTYKDKKDYLKELLISQENYLNDILDEIRQVYELEYTQKMIVLDPSEKITSPTDEELLEFIYDNEDYAYTDDMLASFSIYRDHIMAINKMEASKDYQLIEHMPVAMCRLEQLYNVINKQKFYELMERTFNINNTTLSEEDKKIKELIRNNQAHRILENDSCPTCGHIIPESLKSRVKELLELALVNDATSKEIHFLQTELLSIQVNYLHNSHRDKWQDALQQFASYPKFMGLKDELEALVSHKIQHPELRVDVNKVVHELSSVILVLLEVVKCDILAREQIVSFVNEKPVLIDKAKELLKAITAHKIRHLCVAYDDLENLIYRTKKELKSTDNV